MLRRHWHPGYQWRQAWTHGDAIGSVNETTGDVLIVHKDGTSEPAATGTPVFADDIVATGADGAVEVLFKDGTTFSLGNSGQMRLDNLIYDPAGTNNGLDATLVKGAFVFVTGHVAGAPPRAAPPRHRLR